MVVSVRIFLQKISEEAQRIMESKGRVFCMEDEPGVYRVWMPNGKTPGLAISRAFGDYWVKDFGLISVPDVTQRKLTTLDQFVILATDGVCILFPFKISKRIISNTTCRRSAFHSCVIIF
jgi:serine/threonine protein phosphatase PrpC